MKNVKIAVPTNNPGGMAATRSDHFGHCDLFTVIDLQDGKIAGVDTFANVEHGAGKTAEGAQCGRPGCRRHGNAPPAGFQ